jgi:hypothetical protein
MLDTRSIIGKSFCDEKLGDCDEAVALQTLGYWLVNKRFHC